MIFTDYIKKKIKNNIRFCLKSGRPIGLNNKWMLSVFGFIALIWVLFRLIPKPGRATYPCMKVAIPFASSFIFYITSLIAPVLLFKQARKKISKSYYFSGIFLIVAVIVTGSIGLMHNSKPLFAQDNASYDYSDPLGPNNPIGEAKGIYPGRVVWVHDNDATRAACNPDQVGDAYFLDINCDQDVVDRMFTDAILTLTGEQNETDAWDEVFRYFNSNHGKGNVGYDSDETIFIKVNAVHAFSINADLSIVEDESYGNVDTSPQAILAMLKQLIENAGVPQENIYVGDPFTNIYKHCYDKWSAVYPDVNYVSTGTYPNRTKINPSTDGTIKYSDKGSILGIEEHNFYDCHVNADYLINIPAIKGHRWGGVTFFAKNHFGSNTVGTSWHLHAGLHREDYNLPIRGDYKSYRVMVDLMGHEHLGGKTLIYFGDLLWGTSYEHDPPVKFRSAPFNGNWSSSILLSLDPVAIASVSLDILQAEFKVEEENLDPPRYTYVRFDAIDDYMHQAASSDWWPDGITYDPEGDGTPIGSLGVHEHWNNESSKQYSRNLGTGNGIELVRIEEGAVATPGIQLDNKEIELFPNPVKDILNIRFEDSYNGMVAINILDISGRSVLKHYDTKFSKDYSAELILNSLAKGTYIVNINCGINRYVRTIIKQ